MSVPNKKRLLTYNDLVGEFGATKYHWRDQHWRGDLPNVGTRGKHLFRREDVEKTILPER